MKKCIVIPHSFKGTLSSMEICAILQGQINTFFPECEVIQLPVADGGEGTVDCFLQAMEGGQKIIAETTGPWGETVSAGYAMFADTAVIELASAAGLPMVEGCKDPGRTTTYGVGTLIRDAVLHGAKSIVLGLGGSCTNDGGCGAAAALGVKFFNVEGKAFIPTGATLVDIASIDTTDCDELLQGISITAMCDINNPMFGENGAACVFGPQKGAAGRQVDELDYQLRCLNSALLEHLGTDISTIPGSGAAGAFGAGAVAFFGAELKPGIEIVLDLVQFDQLLPGTDMVFTGEGKIDRQSLQGKVVIGVVRRAKRQGVPVTAIVGDVDDDAYGAYGEGVTAIFSTNRKAISFSEAKNRSQFDLEHCIEDIMRYTKTIISSNTYSIDNIAL